MSLVLALSRRAALRMLVSCGLLATPAFAQAAGNFDFLAAPDIKLNRIFRVNRATGEVGACQYGLQEGAKDAQFGITLCYPPGQGAGPQTPSEYSLVASRHEEEGSVYRVDQRSGTMSICFVVNESVVCTPPK